MESKLIKIKRALISISNKNGILDLVKILQDNNVEIISTGGTSLFLSESGFKVVDVSSITDFPEILDGRVKTLHPKIHGGLLGIRGNANHKNTMLEQEIPYIDLLIVNLYPFEETIAKGSSYKETIENIDIGGPAMIRAAAKNHDGVGVVVDPNDYNKISQELIKNNCCLTKQTTKRLALKAYSRTASYDATISNWLSSQLDEQMGDFKAVGGNKIQSLRYGENPHQSAAFYSDGTNRLGVVTAEQLQGKELSYNNINDTNAAFELVSEFNP
ncbi:MAG: bifunctional phosphoribosylaminoimidazolecarboxamide formyltransferase/IMP cyclohydrolase, partial [Pseudomonadota bacterium]|nr:bifunctional phosphoribosylaminoimidazolecarboxamide formyltransferase/IMP cyclohydrolase [Pseudomonadota bacterium]